MTGKLTFAVYDDVHHQNAEGLEYDLWRIINPNNRVNIKHDRITDQRMNLIIEATTPEQLGAFEIVLYVKDYFERFNENLNVQDSRLVISVGINRIDEDQFLNIHITPTGHTCTL